MLIFYYIGIYYWLLKMICLFSVHFTICGFALIFFVFIWDLPLLLYFLLSAIHFVFEYLNFLWYRLLIFSLVWKILNQVRRCSSHKYYSRHAISLETLYTLIFVNASTIFLLTALSFLGEMLGDFVTLSVLFLYLKDIRYDKVSLNNHQNLLFLNIVITGRNFATFWSPWYYL